jgi:hypothetical protein
LLLYVQYRQDFRLTVTSDGSIPIVSEIPLPSPTHQFASSKWNSWGEALFIDLLPNGTVTGAWWKGQFNTIGDIEFAGDPPSSNFSSIATTTDAMFYAIAGDEILEFAIEKSHPSTFTYVGRIYP